MFWVKAQIKKPRDIKSVILDRNLSQEIIDDISAFKDSPEWYLKKGIPYRRGYLLYGPPGTGKTSFAQAVAGHLEMAICYLNLSGNDITDNGLSNLLNETPENSIILLEDIDALFI